MKLFEENKSWKNAASLCFRKQSFMIGFDDISTLNYTNRYAWTGIIRSDVIYNITGKKCCINADDPLNCCRHTFVLVSMAEKNHYFNEQRFATCDELDGICPDFCIF